MKKPIIAFDMDDVVADSTGSWLLEINKRTGSKLEMHHFMAPGEFNDYYEKIWAEHGIDDKFTIKDLEAQMKADQSHITAYAQSIEVLTKLSEKFDLVVVTARNDGMEKATRKWLEVYFPGLFKQVVFSNYEDGSPERKKGDICKEIGAGWLVDDNPTNCLSAVENGVEAVLFGEYGWHHKAPDHLHRCKDWPAVLEYFDGQS